jgi:hypothetical protein
MILKNGTSNRFEVALGLLLGLVVGRRRAELAFTRGLHALRA